MIATPLAAATGTFTPPTQIFNDDPTNREKFKVLVTEESHKQLQRENARLREQLKMAKEYLYALGADGALKALKEKEVI